MHTKNEMDTAAKCIEQQADRLTGQLLTALDDSRRELEMLTEEMLRAIHIRALRNVYSIVQVPLPLEGAPAAKASATYAEALQAGNATTVALAQRISQWKQHIEPKRTAKRGTGRKKPQAKPEKTMQDTNTQPELPMLDDPANSETTRIP